jgi:hypothetical protein
MNDTIRWPLEDAVVNLWHTGKSLAQIEKILDIKFTFKNNATGKDIPLNDINRCVANKLIGFESTKLSFTDSL